MSFLHAIIIGIVEGITEFLPISSTAHMILAGRLLGIADDAFVKSFEIIIQLGAILAVVALYWRRLLDRQVLLKTAVAFVPTGVVGLTVYRVVKDLLLGNVAVVLLALLVGGVALLAFERFGARAGDDEEVDMSQITYRRALLIGLFQSLAMVPGVSRSAATIVGGTLIGVPKRTIVEFSFLLAIPTMAAATGKELLEGYSGLAANIDLLAVGFVVSFVTALLAIKSFLSFIKQRSFAAFGWYRVVLAVVYFLVFVR